MVEEIFYSAGKGSNLALRSCARFRCRQWSDFRGHWVWKEEWQPTVVSNQSPPLLTADAVKKKSPWSSPQQWQLSSQLPLLSLRHRPILTDALFPEMLFNCQRKLKVKTLSIPLKTVYFEGRHDADLDWRRKYFSHPHPDFSSVFQEGFGATVPKSVQQVWEHILSQWSVLMTITEMTLPWLGAVLMGRPDIHLKWAAPQDDNY